ncbi:MAG: hypothetical protein ORN98_05075, partial [Alphaproteobacteria bacterium]|nr:hypothetical protein [Alphaproteobacteria bacterium]
VPRSELFKVEDEIADLANADNDSKSASPKKSKTAKKSEEASKSNENNADDDANNAKKPRKKPASE